MKPGWVNRVMFCLGQAGPIWFLKYPGLTQILHWITYMASGPDQSNKLDEVYLLIAPRYFEY